MPSPTAWRSASPTGSPSGTTTGSPTVQPRARSPSTSSGPLRSVYTPADARFDATITRAWISVTVPLPQSGLAADFAQDTYPLDGSGRVDGLDHVDQREPGG